MSEEKSTKAWWSRPIELIAVYQEKRGGNLGWLDMLLFLFPVVVALYLLYLAIQYWWVTVPVGLTVYLWVKTNWPKWAKWAGTGVLAYVLIVAAVVSLYNQPGVQPQPAVSSSSSEKSPTTTEGTVSINSGDALTNNPDVTLTLTSADAVSMRFAETTAALDGAAYSGYSASGALTLTGADGVKSVYGQFKDAAGNESAVVSDFIILDTTAPSAKKEVKVGETLTVGEVKWTADIPVRTDTIKSDDEFIEPAKANGVFVIISLTAELIGKESGTIDDSQLDIVDSKGRKFEPTDNSDVMTFMGDSSISLKQVSPNVPVNGTAVFDIATDATGLKLEVKESAFSEEKGYIDLGL